MITLSRRAAARLRAIVGAAHVLEEGHDRYAAMACTFPHDANTLAIVRPGNVLEVQDVVRLANAEGIALYPISCGRNWGMGSKRPVESGLLLELSRMNRIVGFDPDLAWIAVEPGVTFEQVHAFLEESGARLFHSVTGGPPTGSLIGNALERGDGFGRYADRSQAACRLEVVLPDGGRITTGIGAFPDARAAHLHRAGLGPGLADLFIQSNLGIVTQMTFWLQPRPDEVSVFRFAIRRERSVDPAVNALRQLRLEGTLDSPVGLWNDYRVLSMRGPRPPAGADGLTRERRSQLGLPEALQSHRFFGIGGIYAATAALAHATTERVQERLAPAVDTLSFARLNASGELVEDCVQGEPETATLFGDPRNALGLMTGTPSWASSRSLYWRSASASPGSIPEPHRDECGALWLTHLLPASGDAIREVADAVENETLAAGFDPLLAFVFPQPRVAYGLLLLVWDRSEPREDERALRCHARLGRRLNALGYPPARLSVNAMDAAPAFSDDTVALIQTLKRALDPRDVLAPGRYDWRARWER